MGHECCACGDGAALALLVSQQSRCSGRQGILSWGMGQVLGGGSLCQKGLILFWRSSCRYSLDFCSSTRQAIERSAHIHVKNGQQDLTRGLTPLGWHWTPTPFACAALVLHHCFKERVGEALTVHALLDDKIRTSLATSHWMRRRSAAELWRRRRRNSSRPMLSTPPVCTAC